jgi:serine/threonine protein kinase/class 3 adenylate cyclase
MHAEFSPFVPLESHRYGLCFRAVNQNGQQAELRTLLKNASAPPNATTRTSPYSATPPAIDPHTSARLQRARLLQHPSIQRILDLDLTGITPVVLLEDRRPGRWLDQHPLAPQDTDLCQLARDLLAALQEAHRLGLPHGSISTDALLCREDGSAMLDFTGLLIDPHSTDAAESVPGQNTLVATTVSPNTVSPNTVSPNTVSFDTVSPETLASKTVAPDGDSHATVGGLSTAPELLQGEPPSHASDVYSLARLILDLHEALRLAPPASREPKSPTPKQFISLPNVALGWFKLCLANDPAERPSLHWLIQQMNSLSTPLQSSSVEKTWDQAVARTQESLSSSQTIAPSQDQTVDLAPAPELKADVAEVSERQSPEATAEFVTRALHPLDSKTDFSIQVTQEQPAAAAAPQSKNATGRKPPRGDASADDDEQADEQTMPAQLGRFQLGKLLGKGGMGLVYRAIDSADGRPVAIKVLREAATRSESARRRFAKEARMLARVNNPYVANLLEFNEDAGRNFLAIEFVAGGSVGELLRSTGPLPESLAVALVTDAARGLEVAHQLGVVHRDIKPDNLLLTEQGRAWFDYELAHHPSPADSVITRLSGSFLTRLNRTVSPSQPPSQFVSPQDAAAKPGAGSAPATLSEQESVTVELPAVSNSPSPLEATLDNHLSLTSITPAGPAADAVQSVTVDPAAAAVNEPGNPSLDALGSGPFVKLSDFGLARSATISESIAITQQGALLGTPLYMSPEQCQGQPVDIRSDIYSLGATLFHLLSGKPPFLAETPMAVMQKHVREVAPSLRSLRPDISEALSRIVDKCLAKSPAARFADGGTLRQELENLLHGQPTSLALHPATPDARGLPVMEFQFQCELQASPAALWPYVANTDRVNHALGLPAVRYTTRPDPTRGVERMAEARIAGQQLTWRENPYEWIEGRRMSVLREFTRGPFAWFVNVVELQPLSSGGTRLVQTLKATPKHWFGRLLARWQLGQKTPRDFRRVYAQVDSYLARAGSHSPTADAWGQAHTMSSAKQKLLQQRLARLPERGIEPQVLETFSQFLEHASDIEVARIRPLAFADRFQLEAQQVVQACLHGVREGLVTMLWDILCPSCRIPADIQETLSNLGDHSYCPACDLRYDVDFANSVELIFRAHPELREVETRTYCIGGPAWSTHVVAQIRLLPGERFDLELALGEGEYRVRGAQLPFVVDLRVANYQAVRNWELPLNRPPLATSIPVLESGQQVLTLHNNTQRELEIRLERLAGRSLALTAAAASSLALFREMFPDQTLAPGRMISVTTITLLSLELCDAGQLYRERGDAAAFALIQTALTSANTEIAKHRGAVAHQIGEQLLATFSEPISAVQAGLKLLRDAVAAGRELRIAIHRGPAVAATIQDRLDYFGQTAHLLQELRSTALPNELLVTEEIASLPDVDAQLHDPDLKLDILPSNPAAQLPLAIRCQVSS